LVEVWVFIILIKFLFISVGCEIDRLHKQANVLAEISSQKIAKE